MAKPILLLAETGIVLRNLVLGTFADEALQHHALVVAVPNPDDPRLRDVIAGRPIRFVPYYLEGLQPPGSRLQKLLRWQTFVYRFKVAEKATTAARVQLAFDGDSKSLLGRTGMKVIDTTGRVLAKTGLMAHFDALFLRSIARRSVTRQWRALLREVDPAAVLSTTLTLTNKTHSSGDLPPVVAALGLGIPCGTLVQSWDNLSSKAAVLPPALDRYWTWNQYMTDELEALYPRIPRDRIEIVGSPQFDFHRAAAAEPRDVFMTRYGLDPARPFVLLGTGTPSKIPDEHLQFVDIARALHAVRPEVQVIVRLHPKDDGTRWEPLADELRAHGIVLQRTAPPVQMDLGGFVPAREFYREQVSALTHAAAIVNSASTLAVDAAILDRPVICLGYDFAPDPKYPEGRARLFLQTTYYAPLVATGGMRVVHSVTDCVAAITRYLDHPEYERAERARIVAVVAGTLDGGAGQRLAKSLVALAAG